MNSGGDAIGNKRSSGKQQLKGLESENISSFDGAPTAMATVASTTTRGETEEVICKGEGQRGDMVRLEQSGQLPNANSASSVQNAASHIAVATNDEIGSPLLERSENAASNVAINQDPMEVAPLLRGRDDAQPVPATFDSHSATAVEEADAEGTKLIRPNIVTINRNNGEIPSHEYGMGILSSPSSIERGELQSEDGDEGETARKHGNSEGSERRHRRRRRKRSRHKGRKGDGESTRNSSRHRDGADDDSGNSLNAEGYPSATVGRTVLATLAPLKRAPPPPQTVFGDNKAFVGGPISSGLLSVKKKDSDGSDDGIIGGEDKSEWRTNGERMGA